MTTSFSRRLCLAAFAASVGLLSHTVGYAQNQTDSTQIPQISSVSISQNLLTEIKQHNQLMLNLEEMCDGIGPRLTGSPQLRQAQQWAMAKLKSYGAVNVHEEAYDLGKAWTRGVARVRLLNANGMVLDVQQQAWSESSPHKMFAEVIVMNVKTLDEFKQIAPRLRGKIVLAISTPKATPEQEKNFKQYSDELNKAIQEANFSAIFFVSGREGNLQDMHGSPSARYKRNAAIITKEHANLLQRLIARGITPKIEFEFGGRLSKDTVKAYNVVADFPGTELADEMVVLGAHQDSWDLGTGATDNGVGAVVTMEVLRAMHALNLKPKRTLRVVLFSGEEQGLLGSKAYLKAHVAEQAKIQAMLTQDAGGGRITGFLDMKVDEWFTALNEAKEQTKELNSLDITYAAGGGSDHQAFFEQGIPAFAPIQDTLDYRSHTWHSQVDTVDHVAKENLVQNAQVMAVMTWAMLNGKKLPHQAPQVLR
ncbi:M20/M25/M40 family metallo-hydrolase [Undibacterium flavidum]|uniref:Carboxypeptidase Q n=1 Tax=Undibacterium flavidum TaxID=2762297 RepID=A0ABR6Y651_9BURK|nr:M20/M25/M40 family metallo-hydrolase [Undibacterium flavidum]MBC3872095.1 M20/M25/M40 family metallo-hydrolase [Undibacterium flavidum]